MAKPYEPKQKTIRNRCAKLQKKWSADEKKKRRGTIEKPWLPPTVSTQSLSEVAEEQEETSPQTQ